MILAGLWHGANLTFILWGFCWAIYIYIFRFIKVSKNKLIFLFWFFFYYDYDFMGNFSSENLFYAYQYILIMFNFEDFKYIFGIF